MLSDLIKKSQIEGQFFKKRAMFVKTRLIPSNNSIKK